MTAHVHDEQPGMLVVEPEDVEEVAGQALAGNVPPGEARARNGDVGRREERSLHLGRGLQIAEHVGVDS